MTASVAAELGRPEDLRFRSIEDVVASVRDHDAWQTAFCDRYLTYAQRA